MVFFDDLETRSGDERAAEIADALPRQIARAKALGGYKTTLADITAQDVNSAMALARLPVLR